MKSVKKMKISMKAVIIFICVCSSYVLADVENSDWTGYPPMTGMTDVIEFKGIFYGTTDSGLLSYDSDSREYEYFYKNHGLDVSDALCIAATSNEIFIGFRYDGLMRFDPESETFEPIFFPEYVDKDDVTNTIAVKDIYALNDSILYIGHSKGIDRLNISSEEIRTFSKLSSSINEDTAVNSVDVFYGKIWASTLEGLAWADLDNQNLESEEEWDSFKFARGVNCILDFVDENGDSLMYVGTNGLGLFTFDWAAKDSLYTEITSSWIFDMAKGLDSVLIAASDGLYSKTGGEWLRNPSVTLLTAVIEGSGGKMWVASSDGLKSFISSGYWGLPQMNLPRSSTLREMSFSGNDNLWIATSPRDQGGYVLRLENDEWESFSEEDGLPSFRTTSVTVDNSGLIWGTTWDEGLYTIDDKNTSSKFDDTVTLVDPDREIILQRTESSTNVFLYDVTTDSQDNIWVAGYDVGMYVLDGRLPIKAYKYNHFTFNESSSVNYIIKVFPDNEGWVWLGTWDTGLIGVYIGTDPFDTSDDVVKAVPYVDGGGGLLGSRVFAFDIDKDGYVWVGSTGGLNRITKKSDKSLKIDEMNTILGEVTIEVSSIVVDDENNKWIGTAKGLYKLNAGDVLEETYTVDNSGLLSDTILSLTIDKDGEYLWIGTFKGLNRLDISGESAGGVTQQFHMYPNPFEIWGDNSQAVFNNLKSDEPILIYTFTGELVNELDSPENGASTAVWNGRNFRDEFVASGVYFFTGVDKNGSMFKEKMVVIRR
jgi:ligand-binding sensor domain-containing protein